MQGRRKDLDVEGKKEGKKKNNEGKKEKGEKEEEETTKKPCSRKRGRKKWNANTSTIRKKKTGICTVGVLCGASTPALGH